MTAQFYLQGDAVNVRENLVGKLHWVRWKGQTERCQRKSRTQKMDDAMLWTGENGL